MFTAFHKITKGRVIRFAMVAMVVFAVAAPRLSSALTVSPARLEISGDAGKLVASEIGLFNEQTTPSTFYFSTANFEAQGEGGTPNFVSSTTGLASWIKTPESIVLKAGEQKKIPFTITIPEGTQPGGYFAGIFLSTTPTKAEGGGDVSIGARVGILVLLRVNGDIQEGATLSDFQTTDGKSFFTSLPVGFEYRFKNGGSDRVIPDGFITIKHLFGWTSAKVAANEERGNVLPFGSVRKFAPIWGGTKAELEELTSDTGFFDAAARQWKHFAFGRYKATLDVAYGISNKHVQAQTSFWVIPWQLLLLIVGGLLIIFFGFRFIARRYNHWVIMQAEQMLEHERGLDREPVTERPVSRAAPAKSVAKKAVRKRAAPKRAPKGPRLMND